MYTGMIVLPALIVNLPVNSIEVRARTHATTVRLTNHNERNLHPQQVILSFKDRSQEARDACSHESCSEQPLLARLHDDVHSDSNRWNLNETGQSLREREGGREEEESCITSGVGNDLNALSKFEMIVGETIKLLFHLDVVQKIRRRICL